jgi:hypothetical protein
MDQGRSYVVEAGLDDGRARTALVPTMVSLVSRERFRLAWQPNNQPLHVNKPARHPTAKGIVHNIGYLLEDNAEIAILLACLQSFDDDPG